MAAPDLTALLPGRLEMQPAGKFESANFNLFQAIEQGPDAIIVAGRDGAIKVWNRGAETIFGYAAAEVLGKSLDVILP
jgi:PAS domain-containing protein